MIAPWNFPVNLVMSPLAGVFAAGNRAMVKTSEYTPRVAALFEEIVGKYFALDELAFVSGGPDVPQPIVVSARSAKAHAENANRESGLPTGKSMIRPPGSK